MNLYPVAGCKLYIGGVLATKATDFVSSDFTSQTWVLIDGWTAMGPIGDKSALITTTMINRNRDAKMKGTDNAGSMQNEFVVIAEDAGQIALIAARKTKSNFAFKVELNDKPAGEDATPSLRLFIGLVMDATETGGNANTERKLSSTVEINSNIVPVAADDGA